MRARGDSATEILTAESMADKYGVQQGSYDAVPLPTDADVQQAPTASQEQMLLDWIKVHTL
jgi:hypothetical protein